MKIFWIAALVILSAASASAQTCLDLFNDDSTALETPVTAAANPADVSLRKEINALLTSQTSPTKENLIALVEKQNLSQAKTDDLTAYISSLTKEAIKQLVRDQIQHDDKLIIWKASFAAQLESEAMNFFVKNLRVPDLKDLADSKAVFFKDTFLADVIPDFGAFWQKALADNPQKLDDARAVLIRAYYDFAKGLKKGGITARSATVDEIFSTLLATHDNLQSDASSGVFELKHLLRLLGERDRRPGNLQYPVLFDGLDNLRLAAKDRYPSAFKGMRDQKYGQEYNEQTVDLLVNKYNGFLATSLMGKIDYEKGQWEAMKALAEAKNLAILIKEVNGETDGIPPEILAYPRTRVVTQTLDLGDELRIWAVPIIPTNKNPLAGLLERAMARIRGQSQIVFAPQRSMSPVPTKNNQVTGTQQVWSTGSLSKNHYPYSNHRSGRVTSMAAERHMNSVLIVEKPDEFAGPLGQGAPGRWHIRNVDLERAIKDDQFGEWGEGMVDSFMFYPADGSAPRPIPAVAVIPGDYHKGFEDNRFIKSMFEQVFKISRLAGAAVRFMRLHDYQDMDSVNTHDKPSDRAAKGPTGASLQVEVNQGRSNINAIMALEPQLRVILSDQDNHMMWVARQLDNPAALDDPINGPFLKKLAAMRAQGINVIEYLYKLQQAYDAATPDAVQRQLLMENNVYIQHPDQIIVLKKGDPLDVGPAGRTVNLADHGDIVERGKRGNSSIEPQAKANDRVVTGHTHETAMIGYAMNPGMIVRLLSQFYALGPPSAQQNALVVVYANGAMQLFIYDPVIGELYVSPGGQPLQGLKAFTSKPIVLEDSNDLVEDGVTTLNNYDGKPVQP